MQNDTLKRVTMIAKRKSRRPRRTLAADGTSADNVSQDSSDSLDDGPRARVTEVDFIPIVECKRKMPTYFGIGGWAKRCLNLGYDFGLWHLDCTSKSDKLNVYSLGEGNAGMNKVVGGVGVREKIGSLSLTQAWQTDGYMGMISVCKEAYGALMYAVVKGLYGPHGNATAKLDLLAGYERAPFKSEVIIPIKESSPKFMGYVLLRPAESFLLGYRMEVDIEQRAVGTHCLGIDYTDDTTEYMLKLENFKNVRGSIYHRYGDNFGWALKAYLWGRNQHMFELGAEYQIDDNTMIKAKINESAQLGVVYQMQVSENVETNYYFGFDGKSPWQGEHKIGISWSFRG